MKNTRWANNPMMKCANWMTQVAIWMVIAYAITYSLNLVGVISDQASWWRQWDQAAMPTALTLYLVAMAIAAVAGGYDAFKRR